jgi:drug/metabolite transporter (DMT)-like permease
MIFLILSVLASTGIFIIFKGFQTNRVHLTTAIVVNYFTACAAGLLFFGLPINQISWQEWGIAAVLGSLFITLFTIMGKTTAVHGVTTASISNKMSLLFPVAFGVFFFNDQLQLQQWIGLTLGIGSIILVNWSSEAGKKEQLWLPIVLFLGSGCIDLLLDVASRSILTIPTGSFSAMLFGIAGILGLSYFSATKQLQFQKKHLVAGLLLGIVNFGSIYFLLEALQRVPLTRSLVFPINNVSIVSASTLVGIFWFKEHKTRLNWVGVLFAVAALLLLIWER